MLLADTLIVVGMATASLGTIQEADGMQEHSFWLRNAGVDSVMLQQGYTSCGCTTISFDKGRKVAPGYSTAVTLRFNPQGKGGEFYEQGTLVYGANRQRVNMALQGICITSEETLLRQFPISVNDQLRLSADHFDLGVMRRGEHKERGVVVLHRDEANRRERLVVGVTIEPAMAPGVHHIIRYVTVSSGGAEVVVPVTFDVLVR